jgi:cobalt-zinc-cadmium efflux system outer membrane protein
VIALFTSHAAGADATFGKQPDPDASVYVCMDYAERNNPELEASFQRWLSARDAVAMESGFDDPIIGADVERKDTTLSDYANIEWMIRQPLPGFGKRAARESVAGLQAEVAGLEYLEAVRTVRAEVAAAYWDLWVAQKAVDITVTNRDLLSQFEQTARVRYESGGGSQQDVLRAQIELASIENDVETRLQDHDLAKVTVNTLLNVSQDAKRRTRAAPYVGGSHMALISAHIAATSYCPQLLAHERMIRVEESRLRLAKLEGVPDFEVRLEARQLQDGNGINEIDTALFLNIPWLWRGQRRAAVTQAQSGLESAEAAYDAAANAVQYKVTAVHHHAETAQRSLELYRDEIIPRARESITVALALYESGGAGFLDFINAQRTLLEAQMRYYEAVASRAGADAQLDRFITPFDAEAFSSKRDPSAVRGTP